MCVVSGECLVCGECRFVVSVWCGWVCSMTSGGVCYVHCYVCGMW